MILINTDKRNKILLSDLKKKVASHKKHPTHHPFSRWLPKTERNLEKYLHVFYCWKMGRTLLSQDQYCRMHSRFKEQVWSLVSPPPSSKAGRINNFCLHCSFNNPIIPSFFNKTIHPCGIPSIGHWGNTLWYLSC